MGGREWARTLTRCSPPSKKNPVWNPACMKPNCLTQQCAYVWLVRIFFNSHHFHSPTQCLVSPVLLALGFYTPCVPWHLYYNSIALILHILWQLVLSPGPFSTVPPPMPSISVLLWCDKQRIGVITNSALNFFQWRTALIIITIHAQPRFIY